MKVDCYICGTSFKRKPKDVKGKVHLYCSRKCMHEGQRRERPKRQPISGVYVIVNILNFKMYCGSSIDIVKRVYQHFTKSVVDNQKWKVQQDINLMGREFFHFFVLEIVEDPKLLREREDWWIGELNTINSGYNIVRGKAGPLVRKPRIKKIKVEKPKIVRIKKPPKVRIEFGTPVSDDVTLQMIRMWKDGASFYQISNTIGIPESSVRYRVHTYKDKISSIIED